MKAIRSRLISYALILMTVLAVSVPTEFAKADDTNLATNQNELSTMQSDLQGLNASLQQTLNSARTLQTQVSDLLFQSRTLQQQMDQTKQKIQERNDILKERLKIMYQDGDVSFLNVLLDSKSFSDFLDRFSMLTMIAQHDQSIVNDLHVQAKQLQAEQSKLVAQQQEQEAKQNQLYALESDLRAKVQDKSQQIAAKQSEIAQQQSQEQLALLDSNQGQTSSDNSQGATLASRGSSLLSVSGTGPSSGSSSMMMEATGYTAPSYARTATGAQVATGIVAVDPSVIPLGTKLYIEGYGNAVAADTGLDIKGNRIDLFFTSVDQCILFGRRTVKVYRLS